MITEAKGTEKGSNILTDSQTAADWCQKTTSQATNSLESQQVVLSRWKLTDSSQKLDCIAHSKQEICSKDICNAVGATPEILNITGNFTGNSTTSSAVHVASVISWLSFCIGLPVLGLALYTLKNLSKGLT
ncbi:hypothetical protein AMECASPLE_026954 [Ameca splendens]|uniref:Uncharacterized protein n=1 Tax=Ameca splendens TaxID=208324 RepID=A0ABV0XI72_9TELE